MGFRMDGKVWFVWSDPCGILCSSLTWVVLLFVWYSTSRYAFIPILYPSEGTGNSYYRLDFSQDQMVNNIQNNTKSFSLSYMIISFLCFIFQIVIVLTLWSHATCVLSHPGVVTADGSGKKVWEERMGRMEEEELRDVTPTEKKNIMRRLGRKLKYCTHCELFKPTSVHHCRTCNACVKDMDHHCPWVNNCVGENNVKHFLLFLFYVAIGSTIALSAFFWRVYIFSHEALNSQGPSLRMVKRASNPDEAKETIYAIVMGVIAFALSLFFLIFVIGMSCDQYEALTTGVAGIDALQGHFEEEEEQSLRQGFGVVCGEPMAWHWFVPVPARRAANNRSSRSLSAIGNPRPHSE